MPTLVDERAASVCLGLSTRTLQKWRLQGLGPRFVKLGRAVRYDPADLQEFLQASRRRSTSESVIPVRPARTLAAS